MWMCNHAAMQIFTGPIRMNWRCERCLVSGAMIVKLGVGLFLYELHSLYI